MTTRNEDTLTGFAAESVAELHRELTELCHADSADVPTGFTHHVASGLRDVAYIKGSAWRGVQGSRHAYEITFGDGARFECELWGNPDGYGVLLSPVECHVPAVADVLVAMRAHGINQSAAVAFLGGRS